MPASLETLESAIREEAERKIGVAKHLATVRQTLLSAREEFARQDAANVDEFRKALKQARDAGFSERELASLKLSDPDKVKGARPRAAKTTAAS